MQEKIIIKGNFSKLNIPAICMLLIAIGFFVIGSIAEGDPIDFLEGLFEEYIALFVLMLVFVIASIFMFIWLNSCQITVTNKRVFGKAAFGKSVNLPMDMVSAVGTGMLKSLSVSTSSGNINFFLMNNNKEINNAITDLLLKRQENAETNDVDRINVSCADELKKYKELLDLGIITAEEFENKKKQLMRY